MAYENLAGCCSLTYYTPYINARWHYPIMSSIYLSGRVGSFMSFSGYYLNAEYQRFGINVGVRLERKCFNGERRAEQMR